MESEESCTYLDVDEAARYLRLSTSKLYKLVHTRSIRHRKHGSRLAFTRSDLDLWSNSNVVEPLPIATIQDRLFPAIFPRGSLKTEEK